MAEAGTEYVTIDEDCDDKDVLQNRDERGHSEERGKSGARSGKQAFGVADLSSKTLQIQAKKFYLDVKQNKRGRFVKISEVGATGHKNRIILDMSTAPDFHEMLTNFIEEYASLGPRNLTAQADDKIKSDVIYSGERRYYLDLKENSRGRFLKVSMTMPPPSMERQQIVIPAQGMIDIRDSLTDILSEFGTTDKIEEGAEEKLSLESESKVFHFDIGENKRGDYLRISEVSPSFRTAINIPQQIWPEFVTKLRSMAESLSSSSVESSDIKQDWDESVAEDGDKKEQGSTEKLEPYSDGCDYLECDV